MKGLRAGPLTELVQIQTATDTQDNAGQPIRSWSTIYKNVPASVTQISGGEVFRGKQTAALCTHVVECQYLPEVTPLMRVLHNSRPLGIVRTYDRGYRALVMECKEEQP